MSWIKRLTPHAGQEAEVETLSPDEFNLRKRKIQSYADFLFAKFKVPKIQIIFGPPGLDSHYNDRHRTIFLSLNRDFRSNLFIFAHEFRHYLQHELPLKQKVQKMTRTRLLMFCAFSLALILQFAVLGAVFESSGGLQVFLTLVSLGVVAGYTYFFKEIFLAKNSVYCRLFRVLERDADRFANKETGMGLFFRDLSVNKDDKTCQATHPSNYHRYLQAVKYSENPSLWVYLE